MEKTALQQEICRLAQEVEPYAVQCRRTVHTFAETAKHEEKTHAFILEEVKKLGLAYEEIPTTGLIAILDTGRAGEGVVLRADIDALPLAESDENLATARTCHSEQANTCHACGHDAHTAMLLGAMQVLCRVKEQLCGKVYFCFEEGEEINSGVLAMLAALEKYQIDHVWGIHVYAALEEGKLSVQPGAVMAGFAGLKAVFHGKAGHGSRPDLAVNPLFCAANFLNNLCVAFNNQITAGETVTMGITMLHAGTVPNIIGDTATLMGSFRFFNMDEGKHALDIFRNVAEHTAAMHGCTVDVNPDMTFVGAPTMNDAATCAEIAPVLEAVLPPNTLAVAQPWYAGESFSRYLQKYPGALAFLGIQNKAAGFGAEHHNEKFDLNECVLKTGVIADAAFAAHWLQREE